MDVQSFLDRLLGTGKSRTPMVGMVLTSASCEAWMRRSPETGVLHVVSRLLDLVEVQRALASRGASAPDARAVVDQLLAELPDTGRDPEPPLAKGLDSILVATRGAMGAFVAAVADALPAELRFLRAPLAASANELADAFETSIAHRNGAAGPELTLEGWTEDAKLIIGRAQHLSDTKWKNWTIGPFHVFVAVLAHKKIHEALKAKGVDGVALLREMGDTTPVPRWARERPEGYQPRLGAAMYALLVRAERYAAADASDVRIRDLLAALHDEPELARWVERLV